MSRLCLERGPGVIDGIVGITSLKLGDPWWGGSNKAKKLNGFAFFINWVAAANKFACGKPN